ncbi:hypothetical protein C8Q74DRAFT_1370066 [Fomes fomentarius]|nr:hypothetical protein C8Q74DRAFT_1370066 [Fomes fomentarius]
MIQLRYPVPDADNTYALLDPVPSLCEPVVKRTFQVDLKEELKRHRSDSGIRVHRAEARYLLAFNEATQSVALSLSSDVMLKVASGEEAGDDLRKEAEIYDQLRMHQGSIVPTIQGFFCGTINNVKMSVLVMEPWAPLPFPQPIFNALSVSWRVKAMNALIKIHQAGFAVSNVFDFDDLVYKKDHRGESLPMFVNFVNAHKHECPFSGEAIKAYEEIPPDAHSRWRGCMILTMAYFEADLWNPNYVRWFKGKNVLVEDADKVSAVQLVDEIIGKQLDPYLETEYGKQVGRDRMLQKAREGLEAIQQRKEERRDRDERANLQYPP